MKEEKHNEGSGNIGYDHNESDDLLIKVYLIKQQKIDIAGFTCRLHEVNISTLILEGINSAIGGWKEGFVDYQVACVLPIALSLKSVVQLFLIGLIEKRVGAFFWRKFYSQAILSASRFLS